MEKIYLIGFMASGKTTVGKLLAEKLSWQFIDLDEVIEKNMGKKISEIFENFGEKFFRELEHKELMNIKDLKKVVVSVGGGLPVFNNNMEIMKETGFTVFLNVNDDILLERLKDRYECEKRPLAFSLNDEELKELLRKRKEYYIKAHLEIECDYKMPENIALEIVERYSEWKN